MISFTKTSTPKISLIFADKLIAVRESPPNSKRLLERLILSIPKRDFKIFASLISISFL